MGRFKNTETDVVVVVSDDKDERFASPLWVAESEQKAPAKRSSSAK
jgi:hypothetical protein